MVSYSFFAVIAALASPAIFVSARRGGGGMGGTGGGTTTSSDYSTDPPGDYCGATSGCSSPGKYVAPLPIPHTIDGTAGGSDIVNIQKGCQQVFHDANGNACGSETEIWGYDGTWPGPLVRVTKGTPFQVTHINALGDDTKGHEIELTTHHHGLKIAPAYDGHAQPDAVTDTARFGINGDALIRDQGSYTYLFENDMEPGTHWFHDHKMHDTSRNVIMGLAGMFVIDPDESGKYDAVRGDRLPSGEYEIPLVFQDRKFTSTNQFDYPMSHDELLTSSLIGGAGFLGDRMVVNGVHAPYLEVKQTWYRFRFLNGCNARQLDISLRSSGGSLRNSMFQIGTEGGFIDDRKQRDGIYMAPGERYDMLIDFRNYNPGTRLRLKNDLSSSLSDVLEFRVVSGSGSVPSFSPPWSLVANNFPSNPTTTRTLALFNPSGGKWTIEGTGYDPDAANLQVRRGATERWTFTTAMMMVHPHPMHIHLVQFHIDSAAPGSATDGWKDIVMVPGGGSRSVTMTFNGEPGVYMFHCHNMEHEDYDMMLQYEVCDDNDPDHACDPTLLNAFTSGGGGGGGMGGHV